MFRYWWVNGKHHPKTMHFSSFSSWMFLNLKNYAVRRRWDGLTRKSACAAHRFHLAVFKAVGTTFCNINWHELVNHHRIWWIVPTSGWVGAMQVLNTKLTLTWTESQVASLMRIESKKHPKIWGNCLAVPFWVNFSVPGEKSPVSWVIPSPPAEAGVAIRRAGRSSPVAPRGRLPWPRPGRAGIGTSSESPTNTWNQLHRTPAQFKIV